MPAFSRWTLPFLLSLHVSCRKGQHFLFLNTKKSLKLEKKINIIVPEFLNQSVCYMSMMGSQ